MRPDHGSFGESDLARPGARFRARVWVAICTVLLVGSAAVAATSHDWYLWLLVAYFAWAGVQTGRRLRKRVQPPSS